MRSIPRFLFLATMMLAPVVAMAADGEAVFKQQCAMCHGPEGKGMQYVAPALKGNEWVTAADAAAIVKTVREGRAGDAKRHAADFPAVMPPFPQLSDDEVAAVAAYVQGALQE